jgi:tetratricopeptide (TPR) repeat protein
VLLSAEAGKLPFDVAPLRTLPYSLEADGKPANADAAAAALTLLLKEALNHHGEPALDSPVFQLVEGYAPPDISHLKTDVFREQAKYASAARETLAVARLAGSDAVRKAATELGDLGTLESGVVIDIYLSYRATGDWAAMVAAEKSMAEPLRRSTLVQEQLGFALNRLDRRDEAEQVLKALIERHGPNSETNGLLGRVYKDRWEAENKAGNGLLARGWLKKAIETYLQGFEADWRDAYPGINAVTLMEVASPPDPRRTELIPIVTYSLKRRIARANPDYWDYATLLELAVLANDQVAAEEALGSALVAMRESWELGTTARNLALIANARERRGENIDWLNAIILSCSTPSIGQR